MSGCKIKHSRMIALLLLICLCLFSSPVDSYASDDSIKIAPTTITDNLFTAPIRFFRQYLSRADGDRCPMTPSCSRYALNAVAKHGGIKGWILTCDRLMRCGRDETSHSTLVRHRNSIFVHDPVENNDFWWK